jgi:hypothetical protein
VKSENGVLQEEVRTMQAQLDAYSVASYIPHDRGRSVAVASHSHSLNSSPSLSRYDLIKGCELCQDQHRPPASQHRRGITTADEIPQNLSRFAEELWRLHNSVPTPQPPNSSAKRLRDYGRAFGVN